MNGFNQHQSEGQGLCFNLRAMSTVEICRVVDVVWRRCIDEFEIQAIPARS